MLMTVANRVFSFVLFDDSLNALTCDAAIMYFMMTIGDRLHSCSLWKCGIEKWNLMFHNDWLTFSVILQKFEVS